MSFVRVLFGSNVQLDSDVKHQKHTHRKIISYYDTYNISHEICTWICFVFVAFWSKWHFLYRTIWVCNIINAYATIFLINWYSDSCEMSQELPMSVALGIVTWYTILLWGLPSDYYEWQLRRFQAVISLTLVISHHSNVDGAFCVEN